MKNVIQLTMGLAIIIATFSCASQKKALQTETEQTSVLASKMDTVSYMIGMQIGANFASFPDKDSINVEAMALAMKHILGDKDTIFTMEEMGTYWQSYTMELQTREQAKAEEEAEANLAKGEEFLAANKEKEGVIVTESGLQYKVLVEGDGPKPVATDKVNVHYHGTLIDGTVFDSSVERGEPIEFGLNQVISGWTEGLQLMSIGSKYEFYIPANLAYGSQGRQGMPANSVLIFQVELFDIVTE